MVGIYKQNKEEEKMDNLQNPNFIELANKWDVFLSKMNTRFEESLVNVEEALMDNLEENDYDINATKVAWSGMKSQVLSLSTKIDETFDNKVKPEMLQYIESWEILDQSEKGTNLQEEIYRKTERYEIELEGKIAQKYYDYATQLLNENFNCTQCNASIEVKKDIFRSHYVSCDYCNTVNTFIPNDKIAQISWVIDDIAKRKALPQWDEMQLAIEQYRNHRRDSTDEALELRKKDFKIREDKTRAFYTAYLTERFQLAPQFEETFEHDLEVKMKYVYEERNRDFNY